MSYTLTCIINDEPVALEELSADTIVSQLCLAIQRKSGIPPSRQQIFTDTGDVDTSRSFTKLTALALPQDASLYVLDSEPSAPLQMIPNDLNNNSIGFGSNSDKQNINDIDTFLHQYQLTEIKPLLIKHGMDSMDKLTTRSQEFRNLLCDQDILISSCHNMIPRLLTAIQR